MFARNLLRTTRAFRPSLVCRFSAQPELATETLAPFASNQVLGSEPITNDTFPGVAEASFSEDVVAKLESPLDEMDIEVKPDGILYLPEIKYRRALNAAFGPGGWAMVPRTPHTMIGKKLTREYALFAHGRFVSQSRGEQEVYNDDGIPTASEGVKSNALMRCCKDLGLAWQLWDPRFIREFKANHTVKVPCTHLRTGQSKWLVRRKDGEITYPYKEDKSGSGGYSAAPKTSYYTKPQ